MTIETVSLLDPFPFERISYRILRTNENKRESKAATGGWLAFYIDGRDVMNRLDVAGVAWSDEYTVLNTNYDVECRLTVDGITRADVGCANEGGHASKMKSAYTDAFKRAAVKHGIGRYLYDAGELWVKVADRYGRYDVDPGELQKIKSAYERLVTGTARSEAGEPTAIPQPERADWPEFYIWADAAGYDRNAIVRLIERIRIEQKMGRPEGWSLAMVRRLRATIEANAGQYRKASTNGAGVTA